MARPLETESQYEVSPASRLWTWSRGLLLGSLLAVVVLVSGVVLVWPSPTPPPVSLSAAGLNGQVWVLPSAEVVPFLHRQGVDAQPPPVPGTAVVGRVSWTARPYRKRDHLTMMLGDRLARAGVIEATYGPPDDQVSLGSGSMWNATLSKSRWLAGDRDIKTDQGWTTYAQFAAVPASWTGNVWFVAHVLDDYAQDADGQQLRITSPNPVLVVALSSGDHVWWARRIA